MNLYQKYVYEGLLGKVIGVYMGRPFEGWSHEKITEKFGVIDHYVAEELNMPLVVPDDDISGTLTFIRALEDSGLYENTPDEFFGDTWLNYLIEHKTILWWGGMGHSTEHTAYLRLKHGIKSPRSGSAILNGTIVSEQIGAQIFIDAFGLVCPGNPALAAKLARKAASVSHDGEAVYGAMVMAAMLAAAYTEHDMDKLLDIGVSFIPKDSIIAQLHRDIRQWCREDGDWHKTFKRISEKYGYQKYGGNCHIIPNHAVMVMAWAYAKDNFLKAQIIVNSCGWDTDCNAGNVGSLMGIVVGLDKICEDYDFRTPMADRIIVPTADGTNFVSDCWTEARKIANIGCAISKFQQEVPDTLFSFDAPGAVHGFVSDSENCLVSNSDGTALRLQCTFEDSATPCRIITPVCPQFSHVGFWSYDIVGTPRLYSGMTLSARLDCPKEATARLFIDYEVPQGTERAYGPVGTEGVLSLEIPDTHGLPVKLLGLEITGTGNTTVILHSITPCGKFRISVPSLTLQPPNIPGWLHNADTMRGPFSDDKEPLVHFVKNEGTGIAVTGNRWWQNTTVEARINAHIGDAVGLITAYQGLQNYLSLTRRGNSLVLARQYYGEQILAQQPCDWEFDRIRDLKLEYTPGHVNAWLDGSLMFSVNVPNINGGACGVTFTNGMIGVGQFSVTGDVVFVL